jgi:uncharacterized protein YprB with RNaseH-like and TPR domain
MTDKMVSKAIGVLESNPVNKREAVAASLGVTEYKAREIIRKIENAPPEVSGPTWAVFDLETTSLTGHFGRLLCASILTYPSMEMNTFRWCDYSQGVYDDGHLALAVREHIEAHTFSCGYFSKGFDFGFLNARLMAAGHSKIRQMLHLDPMWAFRGWRGPKIGSSSMDNVAEFLGLDEQKMKVPKEIWSRANGGDIEALDILVERCESDVRVTWKIACYVLENQLLKTPLQMYP